MPRAPPTTLAVILTGTTAPVISADWRSTSKYREIECTLSSDKDVVIEPSYKMV